MVHTLHKLMNAFDNTHLASRRRHAPVTHTYRSQAAVLAALHAVLSLATIFGPGRQIIAEGAVALKSARPDMNTLVAMGALSALGVSGAAALLPQLGWATFFEEPAMLLGVVLLGRTLEERAKLKVRLLLVPVSMLVMQAGQMPLTTLLHEGQGSRCLYRQRACHFHQPLTECTPQTSVHLRDSYS